MAMLPLSPRICPMFGVTMHKAGQLIAPNKAAGSLNIASDVPPSFRNTATNQNHRAGKSIPPHNVPKTDGGEVVGFDNFE